MAGEPANNDGELELSLGLSIGGGGGGNSHMPPVAIEPLKGFLRPPVEPSSVLLPLYPSEESPRLSSDKRRGYQALRRKEARRKQEEKLLRKGIVRTRSCLFPTPEDRVSLEAQENLSRAIDREDKENEANESERSDSARKGREESLEITPIPNASPNPNPNPNPAAEFDVPPPPPPYPLMPMQLPYQPMPVVQYGGGYAIPCMVPVWAPALPTVAPMASPPPPVTAAPCPSLPPLNYTGNLKLSQYPNKMASSKGLCSGLKAWSGSLGKSASDVSEYHRGSSSSSSTNDVKTTPTNTVTENKPQLQIKITRGHSDQNISYGTPLASLPSANSQMTTAPIVSKPDVPTKEGDGGGVANIIGDLNQPEETKSEPKMKMPFVATTGDDGKTITGYLFRCTSAEVSIMCFCHRGIFTPAEFVKHAGGSDMVHPLKHIVIIPSV